MDLIARGLEVRLGPRAVLHGVDLTPPAGAVTTILGPNGSGKTTLLRALAGLVRPAAGAVTLGGRDLAAIPARARVEAVGYLPQSPQVHWNVAAGELVALGARGLDRFADASEAMAATDTLAFADRPIATLSGGERARVLLARVLAGRPRWLLADEPLANLDPAHAIDMAERLRVVARGGVGVVVVLHDLALAAGMADHAVLVRDGRIAAAGGPRAIFTEAAMIAQFGVLTVPIDPASPHIRVPVARA